MSSCVIPVLERFKRSNKSARVRSRKAANRETAQATAASTMAPDTVRMMMPRSSSVPPEPRSRRGIALTAEEGEEDDEDVARFGGGGARNALPLPRRDSRGFTISKSGPGNVLLRIRHDNPTLDLGDAAYQREHQAHRMNVRQYQELQRQLGAGPLSGDGGARAGALPPRGVMSLGLPDNLRPATLFRRIRDHDSGSVNSNSNLDSSNSSGDYKRSLPRRTKKPSTFERSISVEGQLIRNFPAAPAAASAFASESHFYSSLKRSDSFSSGRGSDSTCSSVEAAEAGMAVATFIPPNGGRRPPSYLLPKALSPCPPTKMHPFIPNLDSALRQVRQQQQRADHGRATETAEKRKGRPHAMPAHVM